MITRLKFRSGLFLDRFSTYQRPVQASHLLALRSSRSLLRHIGHNAFSKAPLDVKLRPLQSGLTGRISSALALAVLCSAAGIFLALYPGVGSSARILTDEETLRIFIPPDKAAREIEEFINNHPLAKKLRSMPKYSESRPHLKIPPDFRDRNLTGGTLMGPGGLVVPPFTWTEEGGKSLFSIAYLGKDLCGHPGIVHGGFLATICDEGMGRCCFDAFPSKIAVTANLKLDYRKPVPAESFVLLQAVTTKVEGRKAWVNACLSTLPAEGEDAVILAEASSIFVEPKSGAVLKKVFDWS